MLVSRFTVSVRTAISKYRKYPQRMYPYDFGEPVTFPLIFGFVLTTFEWMTCNNLAPPTCQKFLILLFITSYLQNNDIYIS